MSLKLLNPVRQKHKCMCVKKGLIRMQFHAQAKTKNHTLRCKNEKSSPSEERHRKATTQTNTSRIVHHCITVHIYIRGLLWV